MKIEAEIHSSYNDVLITLLENCFIIISEVNLERTIYFPIKVYMTIAETEKQS